MNIVHLINVRWFNATAWYALRLIESGILAGDRAAAAGLPDSPVINKAKELGMNDTNFKNCHGLDEDEHLTSSYDIALMSRELLLKHPTITKYTTIYMDELRGGKTGLVNTNKLVRNYAGCTGLKTGSTSLALFNLSASATRDRLIPYCCNNAFALY